MSYVSNKVLNVNSALQVSDMNNVGHLTAYCFGTSGWLCNPGVLDKSQSGFSTIGPCCNYLYSTYKIICNYKSM